MRGLGYVVFGHLSILYTTGRLKIANFAHNFFCLLIHLCGMSFSFLPTPAFFPYSPPTSTMCCRFSLLFCAHCRRQELIPFKTRFETKVSFLRNLTHAVVLIPVFIFCFQGFVF